MLSELLGSLAIGLRAATANAEQPLDLQSLPGPALLNVLKHVDPKTRMRMRTLNKNLYSTVVNGVTMMRMNIGHLLHIQNRRGVAEDFPRVKVLHCIWNTEAFGFMHVSSFALASRQR